LEFVAFVFVVGVEIFFVGSFRRRRSLVEHSCGFGFRRWYEYVEVGAVTSVRCFGCLGVITQQEFLSFQVPSALSFFRVSVSFRIAVLTFLEFRRWSGSVLWR
jgi:hypothetical protein